MRKICAVVHSRANYGRIKTLLQAVKEHPELELQLVVGASALLGRYGSVHKIIEEDGFKINAKVYIIIEGETPTTMAKSTGLAIVELSTIDAKAIRDSNFKVVIDAVNGAGSTALPLCCTNYITASYWPQGGKGIRTQDR